MIYNIEDCHPNMCPIIVEGECIGFSERKIAKVENGCVILDAKIKPIDLTISININGYNPVLKCENKACVNKIS